jgi:hypothetical protein
MKVLAVVAGIITVPLARLQAQVGLWVQSGNTWTGITEIRSLGPVNLRWRWDGAEVPTLVRWNLTTQPPDFTQLTNPVSLTGNLQLPAKGGEYEPFTVTPHPAVHFPFYIRVRVDLAARGDTPAKSVFSRWITVRQMTLVPRVTEPTRAAPTTTGSIDPLKTAADATPLRITLARIHTKATARTDYEAAGPGATGPRAPVNRVYAMMVSIELNRSNLEQSLVRVKATPVYSVTPNSTVQAHIPIWGPDDAARPIAGTGGDVLLMIALMQRYGDRALGISEALILKGLREQLSLIKGITPSDVKQVLFKRFAQDNEKAAEQGRNDRPVPFNVWSRPVLLTPSTLQRARDGEIVEVTQTFGTATGLGSTGGQFTVVFDMRR